MNKRTAAKDQPLGKKERALLERAQRLFAFFEEKLREDHMQMHEARKMRARRNSGRSETSPGSNTLGSCVDNAVADQIDNMPEAKMIPEREETAWSAEEMSDVVAYVLYQARWADTYQQLMEDSIVTGTGVAQAFWDEDMERGEGMVNVIAWHPEDFYPDPMYENIQDGRACFKATRTSVDWVEEHYPHAKGYVRGDGGLRSEDAADPMYEAAGGDKTVTLIEYWYKHYDAEKRRYRVHMAQMAGGALLYSTELGYGGAGKEEYREGVYAHGEYPFVMFRYRRVFRRPFGTGLIYDYRDTQNAIDRYAKYIDDNARESSVQRHFIRRGSGVNADEIADLSRTIIEWEGSDIREVLQTVQAAPLSGEVYRMMNYLVATMKEDSGQNQFTRGEGGRGVTAGIAIQALQEAGGKIMRWHTEQYKAAFRDLVVQMMWILSEYMEPGRRMRIAGGWDGTGNMTDRFVELIAPEAEGDRMEKPAYSVRVQVQKNNPLQIQADNEFLTQAAQICAQSGEPLPAESVIGLMEGFRTKSSVLRTVQENSRTRQEMQQLRTAIEQLAAENEQMKMLLAEQAAMLATEEEAQMRESETQEKSSMPDAGSEAEQKDETNRMEKADAGALTARRDEAAG